MIKAGRKPMVAGNGLNDGTAYAQQLVAELVNWLVEDRQPTLARTLSAAVLSLATFVNDYIGEFVLTRQIQVLGSQGDELRAISSLDNFANHHACTRTELAK